MTAIRHTSVPDSFGLSVSQVSACGVWLHASGELDLAAADTLRDLLDSERGAGHRFARLEVSHVTHVGAECLTVLQRAHEDFLAGHGVLILVGVSAHLEHLLRITRLDQVLFYVRSAEDDVLSRYEARRA